MIRTRSTNPSIVSTRSLVLVFFGVLAVGYALFTFLMPSLAHAQAPDPVAIAATSTDALAAILTSYGPLWGGMAIVFGAASTALEHNKSTHWIAQGRTLAVIVAVVGLGVAGLQAHFTGAPWSGVVMTLVLGAFKLINPNTVAPQTGQAGSSSTTKAGTIATVALLASALVACGNLSACGAAQHGGQAVIDCTGGGAPGIVANILSTLNQWNQDEAGGGCKTATGFDWSCIESKAIAKGEQIGGCALAELVQDILSPPAGRAAPSIDSGVFARTALEDFRAKHARGASFHFATGDL